MNAFLITLQQLCDWVWDTVLLANVNGLVKDSSAHAIPGGVGGGSKLTFIVVWFNFNKVNRIIF